MTPISPDQYETVCFTCGACVGKPWVGLTDEEIDYLEDAIDPAMYRVFARRIEAKLKEKNNV